MTTEKKVIDRWQDRLDPVRLWNWLLLPRTLYVLAWVVAMGTTAVCLIGAWIALNSPGRRDGNYGHVNIDFGGQWLLARMLVEGHGRHLYNRSYQREVLREAYPVADQDPAADKSDVEDLMYGVMGRDDPQAATTVASFLAPFAARNSLESVLFLSAGKYQWQPGPVPTAARALAPLAAHDPLEAVNLAAVGQTWGPDCLDHAVAPQVGGPLYPPVHAVFYSPLGFLKPQTAYRVNQVFGLLLAFVIGWGVRQLAHGRIWWPVAITATIVFPGFGASVALGQNAGLTLAILVWGWVLIARGQHGWGGALWGFLVFKPVWLLAFLLVPMLWRRWRVCLAMICTAGALAALTLPLVGWHSWLNWLQVGQEGTEVYNTDENWVHLSRDLMGIPRRWLIDFDLPRAERANSWDAPTLIGWGLWLGVVLATVFVAFLRRRHHPAREGPAAAFLLLGAWLSCFHFMLYDVCLAALPVFLLFTEPRRYLERKCRAIVLPSLVLLLLLTHYLFPFVLPRSLARMPWETFCLMAMWLWCGWLWLRERPGLSSPASGDPA